MPRSIALGLAGALLLAAHEARAQDALGELDRAEASGHGPIGYTRPFGAGIVLGEPSGLTAKLMLGGPSGLQLHVGYGIGERGRLVVALDYLYHVKNVIPPPGRAGSLIPYVGGGGRLGIRDDDPLLGFRIPIGIAFLLRAAPVEIFLEVAPGIGLVPATVAIVDGGLGGRFYF